jgi:hypothetical protein
MMRREALWMVGIVRAKGNAFEGEDGTQDSEGEGWLGWEEVNWEKRRGR